jgi:hypothetical protein
MLPSEENHLLVLVRGGNGKTIGKCNSCLKNDYVNGLIIVFTSVRVILIS